MDVAVTELRARLSDWLARAREREEVVVTIVGCRSLGSSGSAPQRRSTVSRSKASSLDQSRLVGPRPPVDVAPVHADQSPCERATALTGAARYFDSSALVELVVEEPGSDIATDLWDGCDAAL